MDDTAINEGANEGPCSEMAEPAVADWVPTGLIEDELYNAIQQDGSEYSDDLEYEEIDDSWDEDEYDDDGNGEEEERNVLYQMLSDLRPELCELLAKSRDN